MYKATPRFLLRRYELLKRIQGGNSFLEIGAGNLNFSLELLSKFKTGTALEFSDEVKTIYGSLNKQIRKRLNLIVDDFFQVKFDKKYDLVVTSEVMEHVKNDKEFLNITNSILKDTGQLLLSVPARMKFWNIDDENVGHYRRYEKKGLYDLLTSTGFTDVQIISYGYPFTNLLRIPRINYEKNRFEQKSKQSKELRSKSSGIQTEPSLMRSFRLLINEHTFLPLNFFSSLFNNFDLSDGYIAVANKK